MICFSNQLFAQIDKFIYDLESRNGKIDIDKLTNLIPLRNNKNIILLSEDRHDFTLQVSIKTELICSLAKKNKLSYIFDEFPMPDFRFMSYKLLFPVNIDSFINLGAQSYSSYIKQDFKEVEADPYNDFLKAVNKAGLLDKVIPIDIGTNTWYLGLFHLANVTKSLNIERNKTIDWFCDSIKKSYSLEYNGILETRNNSEKEFAEKMSRIKTFLNVLRDNDKYFDILNEWENVFASYYQYFYFKKKYPAISKKELTPKEVTLKNSFRDSLIYDNFKFHMAKSETWDNIVIAFSSYHLLDTRDNKTFEKYIDPQAHTLGKYLHEKYGDSIFHIAFVCNSGIINDDISDNQYYKESLEHKLSLKHNYAYVDLKAYRSAINRSPFYLRPTFNSFIRLNWENILDGIVFSKDCGCTSGKK